MAKAATAKTASVNAVSKTAKAKVPALITDEAALKKMGDDIIRGALKQDAAIQLYLRSQIAHIEAHHNPTNLNQFLTQAQSTGLRVQAMHKMVQVCANVKWVEPGAKERENDKKKGWTTYYKWAGERSDEARDKAFQQAETTKWTDFVKNPEPRDFSLQAQLVMLYNRAADAAKNHKATDKNKVEVPESMMDALQNVILASGVDKSKLHAMPGHEEPQKDPAPSASATEEPAKPAARRGRKPKTAPVPPANDEQPGDSAAA